MKHETKLTLLDKAKTYNGKGLRPIMADTWEQRYHARRYIFDLPASERVGEMMRDCVDLMVDNIEFARPPFPTLYLEVDMNSVWQAWRPWAAFDESGDQRVGFLMHNGLVMVLAGGTIFQMTASGEQVRHVGEARLCGITFRINRPQSVPYSKLIGKDEVLADRAKAAFVFGGYRPSVTRQSGAPRDPVTERTLTHETKIIMPELTGAWTHSQVAAHFDVMPAYLNTTPAEMLGLSFLGGGDPLMLTVMLLLLNQPAKLVGLTHQERERGIWKGKLFNFKEHNVVTVKLDKQFSIRDNLHTTDRASPHRHPVQGHWRNLNRHPTCNHHYSDQRQAWEPVGAERTLDGDYKRYWCPLCLQRRVWLENFERGTGEHPTSPEYHVTR